MTPAREDILPQPRKESRQSLPRPCPGLSFKLQALPSAARPSAPAAGAPLSPSPHPRAPLPPDEPAPPAPEWGAALPSLGTQARSHTKIIFCTPARAAEVINIRGGAAIKVRPGDAAATGAFHRGASAERAPGAAPVGRGQVGSALLNSEATSELLNQRERERERSRKKVFRVQINLKALRRRAYLKSEGAIFQRVLRTCGLDTSGPKIDNLNDQAAHVACKRVKWSPASVRLYVMWYIMLDVNSPKP